MEKLISFIPYFTLGAGLWALTNGILHDTFVLINHGKTYNRELLRLLLDGHILIFSGIFQILAYRGIQHGNSWGYPIAIIACISLLVYCGMIFPFLRSIVTITINSFVLLMLLAGFFKTT